MSCRRWSRRPISWTRCCGRRRGRSGSSFRSGHTTTSKTGRLLLMRFCRSRSMGGMESIFWRRKLFKVDGRAYRARRHNWIQVWTNIYKVAIKVRPNRSNQRSRQSHLGLEIQGSQVLLPSRMTNTQRQNQAGRFQWAILNPKLQDWMNLETK